MTHALQPHRSRHAPASCQRGVLLHEALVGILIFSIGLLTIADLQTQVIARFNDARYRSAAALLANRIITALRTEVSSASPGAPPWAQLQARFSSSSACETDAAAVTTGTISTASDGYCRWRASVAATLPMGNTHPAPAPLVEIDATGLTTVTLFWRTPGDDTDDPNDPDSTAPEPHQHTTVAHITSAQYATGLPAPTGH